MLINFLCVFLYKTLLMKLWMFLWFTWIDLILTLFVCLLCRSNDWKNTPPLFLFKWIHSLSSGGSKDDSAEDHVSRPVPVYGWNQGVQSGLDWDKNLAQAFLAHLPLHITFKNCLSCFVWYHYFQHNLKYLKFELFFHFGKLY